jgi:hypothetical protein
VAGQHFAARVPLSERRPQPPTQGLGSRAW